MRIATKREMMEDGWEYVKVYDRYFLRLDDESGGTRFFGRCGHAGVTAEDMYVLMKTYGEPYKIHTMSAVVDGKRIPNGVTTTVEYIM